MFHLSRKRQKI